MNNIVIGLGGTGGKIINKLKHKLYEKSDMSVEYLYVDSNFDLVDRDKHLWKAFGNDISLGENNKYNLTSEHLHGAFDFAHNTIAPKYASWSGKIDNWRDIKVMLQGGDGAVYGNQRRRLGRMLLAGHINDILNRINFLVQGLQQQTRTNATTFHICAGLSGGTGSGSFIDVLAKLKQAYPGGNNKFILYLFLPEDNPDMKRLTGGNYFANAYAALKELNSLYTGNWIPSDISKLNQKINLGQKASFIATTYIVTNTNSSQCLLNVEDMQPEEMVADFISLRLTNSDYATSLGSTENSASRQPEYENGKHIRSRDFFSFGIKRVIYPKEEINEYMIYHVLHRVTLALRYNKWNEQKGYVQAKSIENIDLLTSKLLREFRLTPKFLLLNEGILNNENIWQDCDEEWSLYIDIHTQNSSEDGLDKKEAIISLIEDCDEKFEKRYRNVGVKTFFRDAQEQTNDRVIFISKVIQEYLVSEWLRGAISLPQIEMILDDLIKKLHREKVKIQEAHNKLPNKIDNAHEEMLHWKDKLENSWFIQQKEFNNTKKALLELYSSKTKNESYTYANSLVENLISRVQDFKREYTKLVGEFKDFSDTLEKGYSNRLIKNHNDTIEKIYDKELIDTLLNNMILNNKNRMNLFKNSIEQLIDDKKDFNSLVQVFKNRNFIFQMESIINNELHDVIKSISNTQTDYDITSKNIIKELEDKYGNDPQALNMYMKGLINESTFYLPFDDAELQEVVDNNRILEHNKTVGYVLYPDIEDMPFKEDILTALKRINQSKQPRNDDLVNELTVFDIQPGFPLRYISKLKRLSDEYESRYVGIDAGDIDVKIHLEGKKKDYKEFLLPSIAEMQENAIYKLFILDAFGLIKESNQLGLHVIKYSGTKNIGHVSLGNEFIAAYRTLNTVADNMVIDITLDKALKEVKVLDFIDREKRKKELKEKIDTQYESIASYFQERDESKIAFWGIHAGYATDKIEEL